MIKNEDKKSIFSAVSSYSPREKRTPNEDFLTEAFAWVLDNIRPFAVSYLKFLAHKCDAPCEYLDEKTKLIVTTQFSVDLQEDDNTDNKRGRIDLIISADKTYFICEHKIESGLSENQIKKYMDNKHQIDASPEAEFFSVLLTKDSKQHTQQADVSIIWGDIIELISEFLECNDALKLRDREIFIIEQLKAYMIEKGLEKAAPIEEKQLETYFQNGGQSREEILKTIDIFLRKLIIDIEANEKSDSTKIGIKSFSNLEYNPKLSNREGRRGIYFFPDWDDRTKDRSPKNGWHPGLFVGTLPDPDRDNKIEPVERDRGFDVVVITDVLSRDREAYLATERYRKMCDYMDRCNNMFEYRLVKADNLQNPYRLVVLQKPLLDTIFLGGATKTTPTPEEQYERFKDTMINGIRIMVEAFSQNNLQGKT